MAVFLIPGGADTVRASASERAAGLQQPLGQGAISLRVQVHGVGLEPGSAQQLAKAVVVQHQSVLLCQLPVKGRTIGKQGLAGHGHQQHLGTAALYRLYHGGEIGLERPFPAAVQYVIPPPPAR